MDAAGLTTGAKILDAPTGYGRHAHWLAKRGYAVVALDWDAARIDHARETTPKAGIEIFWRVANLEEPSGLMDGSFDAMVCIHYFSENIVARAFEALKPGGILIFETYGGQGGNWRDLPAKGWIVKALRDRFVTIAVEEIPVGPSKQSVALKVVARKV